jgi:precorrin-8X/cobalt-precorrin-8 methylmutase
MIFDRYITVDWRASNRPRTGKDSIWICTLGLDEPPSTMNPRTRGAAEAALHRLLATAVDHRERVLIGFDFPYGYPRGLETTAIRTRAIASRSRRL